jgi:hypothetical protein
VTRRIDMVRKAVNGAYDAPVFVVTRVPVPSESTVQGPISILPASELSVGSQALWPPGTEPLS